MLQNILNINHYTKKKKKKKERKKKRVPIFCCLFAILKNSSKSIF